MARPSKREVSSDDAYSSEEEAQVNDQVNVEEDDDEELEAVARSANSDIEDVAPDEAPVSDDEVVPAEDDADEVPLRFCFPSIRIRMAGLISGLVVLECPLSTVRVSSVRVNDWCVWVLYSILPIFSPSFKFEFMVLSFGCFVRLIEYLVLVRVIGFRFLLF